MARLDNPTDPRARLHRGAGAVLRHAVEARQPGGAAHHAVRRSLRSLCRVARTQGVHAEQLVLICKEAWRTHPSAHEISRETGTLILTSVISQCIDEFYRTDGADMAPAIPAERACLPEASLSFMLGPLS